MLGTTCTPGDAECPVVLFSDLQYNNTHVGRGELAGCKHKEQTREEKPVACQDQFIFLCMC